MDSKKILLKNEIDRYIINIKNITIKKDIAVSIENIRRTTNRFIKDIYKINARSTNPDLDLLPECIKNKDQHKYDEHIRAKHPSPHNCLTELGAIDLLDTHDPVLSNAHPTAPYDPDSDYGGYNKKTRKKTRKNKKH